MDKLHEIEQAHDRERLVHWGPRTLDLDILFYEDQISDQLISYHGSTQFYRNVNAGSFYIEQCSFIRSKAEYGSAVAILSDNENTKVLIEDSIFINCISTSNDYNLEI